MATDAAHGPPRKKLSTLEAAGYVGLGKSTLDRSRITKRIGGIIAPPHIKIGARVLYDVNDLDTWLEANKRRSTSEMIPAPAGA
jgi:hypothetical protein